MVDPFASDQASKRDAPQGAVATYVPDLQFELTCRYDPVNTIRRVVEIFGVARKSTIAFVQRTTLQQREISPGNCHAHARLYHACVKFRRYA
jgi:hypothetical protein